MLLKKNTPLLSLKKQKRKASFITLAFLDFFISACFQARAAFNPAFAISHLESGVSNNSQFHHGAATEAISGNIILFSKNASNDAVSKNRFLHHVESLRKEFLLKTGFCAYEEIPILILLVSDDSLSKPTLLKVERTSSQLLKIQLAIRESLLKKLCFSSVISSLNRELVTAFFLQAVYHENPLFFSNNLPLISLPAWFTIGLTEALQKEYRVKLNNHLLLPEKPLLKAFLQEEPPWDYPLLMSFYAAQACLLVESCFQTQKNRSFFQKDLASLTTTGWVREWNQGEIEHQWWSLIEKKNALQQRDDDLSMQKSLQQFESLLIISVDKEKNSIVTPKGKPSIAELIQQLQSLQSSSNPVVEEILQEYLQFLSQISTMPATVVSKKITYFQKKVLSLRQFSQQVGNFLNCYEETQEPALREELPLSTSSNKIDYSNHAIIEKYLDLMEEKYK